MIIPLRHTNLVLIFLLAICFFGYMYYKACLPKEKIPYVEGAITYIGKTLGNNPNRDFGLYRYLKLDGYGYPLALYIDNPAGQNRFDSLQIGDNVRAYLNGGTSSDQLNHSTVIIEKDGLTYYHENGVKKQMSIIMIIFGLLCCGGSYTLYKKGKIPY